MNRTVSVHDENLIIANNAFIDKKFDLAAQYYSGYIYAKNSNNINVLHKYAMSLLFSSEKNVNLIINAYKNLFQHPNSSDIINFEVINQLRNLGMAETLKKLSTTIKNPLYLATIYRDLDIEKSVTYLKFTPMENRNSEYYVLSADIHFELGQYLETIGSTDKLILMGYYGLDVYYQRAQAFLRTNQTEKANTTIKLYEYIKIIAESKNIKLKLNAAESIIDMHSSFLNNIDFKVVYLTVLLQNNEKDRVIDTLNAIDIKTLSSENKKKLLQVAIKLENHDVLNLIYDKISQPTLNLINLSSDETIIYCQYFIQTSNFKKAQEICKFGLNQYPHIAPLSYWNAQLLLKNQKINESIKLLHQSIKFAPWMNAWRIQLAQLYLSQGKSKKALKVVQDNVVYQNQELDNFIRLNGLKIHHEN